MAAAAFSGDGYPTEPAIAFAMGIAFLLQAVCLVLVLTVGQWSGALSSPSRWCRSFLLRGERSSGLLPVEWSGDYYGTRCATANYGLMYSAKGVASIIGGGLAALLFERFGTWTACFYGSAVLAVLAAGLISACGGPPRR